MEVAPTHVNVDLVQSFLLGEFHAIADVKNVRIWSIADDVVAFSAHIVTRPDAAAGPGLSQTISAQLRERFGSSETTLELGRRT